MGIFTKELALLKVAIVGTVGAGATKESTGSTLGVVGATREHRDTTGTLAQVSCASGDHVISISSSVRFGDDRVAIHGGETCS
jgi:hypothetical protein